MTQFSHNYPFDPSYGYNLDGLLSVPAPQAPADFQQYWQLRYQHTLSHTPHYSISACGAHAGYLVYDLSYASTNHVQINGWLLLPEHQQIKQGIVVGHGYGGRDQPDYHLAIPNTAFIFPCFRGLARSAYASVSSIPDQHVLHGIHNRDDYILGGCVEDIWMAVSVLLDLYPHIGNAVGYMGISFGGGIGALALPWDKRIQRAHFNVPTFGNQPLRLTLQTIGSAAAVRQYASQNSHIAATLAYYDAASAAGFVTQAGHFALAQFDPVVAPPGQFSLYNAWAAEKHLFILDAGHFDYPNKALQEMQLLTELQQFFGDMQP
ncbi:acetylxylan esterase [Methylomonas sp. AM2-LC]|uniref:acetylxylan esterase n=1 Tax=Methylomonas sp. AM2-LC TaxID=3153301 RepID=UPI00326657B3